MHESSSDWLRQRISDALSSGQTPDEISHELKQLSDETEPAFEEYTFEVSKGDKGVTVKLVEGNVSSSRAYAEAVSHAVLVAQRSGMIPTGQG